MRFLTSARSWLEHAEGEDRGACMHGGGVAGATTSRESPCVKRGGGNVFFGGASWWREAREGEGVSHVYDQSRVRFFMQLAGFSFCGCVGG